MLKFSLVRATNSNSRDLEEIHQRKLFYEKYPRDIDLQSSVKSSPVPSSETRSTANETAIAVTDENLEDSKENNDFDLPPLEEIPKLPDQINHFMDDRWVLTIDYCQ